MSDIDFDELDKAVSSLMEAANKSNKQPEDTEKTEERTEESPSTQEHVAAPQLEEPQPKGDVLDLSMEDSIGVAPAHSTDNAEPKTENVDNRSEAVRPAPAVAERPAISVKKRGQFMDVMHPSANMKNQSEAAAEPPKMAPTRKGVSLQPTGQVKAEDFAPEKPVGSVVDKEGDSVSAVDAAISAAESESAWNARPIVADAAPQDHDTTEAAHIEAEHHENDDDGFIADLQEASMATNSPFLPDTKVEKRPLGGVVDQATETHEDSKEEEVEELDYPGKINIDDEELPQEFEAELVSLEADDTSAIAAAKEEIGIQPPKIEYDESDLALSPQPAAANMTQSVTASPSLPSRTPTEPVDAGADEDAHSSIFDTAASDNLAAQSRHTSSWYTVVIFAGMVMIGVLCAIVYYFVTNGV